MLQAHVYYSCYTQMNIIIYFISYNKYLAKIQKQEQKKIQEDMQQTSYNKLLSDLQSRQKHIIQLQSQLLRIDYQYAIIVKQLKTKYAQLANDYSQNKSIYKQIKKQNKKLMIMLQNKQKQICALRQQIQNSNNKYSTINNTIKYLQEQKQVLLGQIKYMENNRNKYQLRIIQLEKKKQLYKDEMKKLQHKIEGLQRNNKKLYKKKKQLQQLVEQQVIETQQRIQNIGVTFINRNRQQLQQTQKILQKCQRQKQYISNISSPANTLHNWNRNNQDINDWQMDMKKLKNCIEYGNSYILVFQPSNLDRMVSRQIFHFIKKYLKDKAQLENQLQALNEVHQNTLISHRKMLQNFQKQLQNISQSRNKTEIIQIDTQIQTQNVNSPQAQRAVFQLNQLNMKLKIKNSIFVEIIELLALRNVVTENYLSNCYINEQYLKNIINKNKIKPILKQHTKPINKFRVASLAILFLSKLQKKSHEAHPIPHQPYQKLTSQSLKLQKICPHNIYLQKLKQIKPTIIQNQNITIKINQIISFYQYKYKNILSNKSIDRQLLHRISF